MHATLHDFSFSDEELLHLGNQCARPAAPLSIPVLSRSSTVSTLSTSSTSPFQVLLVLSRKISELGFCRFGPGLARNLSEGKRQC